MPQLLNVPHGTKQRANRGHGAENSFRMLEKYRFWRVGARHASPAIRQLQSGINRRKSYRLSEKSLPLQGKPFLRSTGSVPLREALSCLQRVSRATARDGCGGDPVRYSDCSEI